MKDCADIGAELGLDVKPGYFPGECCDSCHDDQSFDGTPLIRLADADADVCCEIARIHHKRKAEAGDHEETQA